MSCDAALRNPKPGSEVVLGRWGEDGRMVRGWVWVRECATVAVWWRCQCEVIRKLPDVDRLVAGRGKGHGCTVMRRDVFNMACEHVVSWDLWGIDCLLPV